MSYDPNNPYGQAPQPYGQPPTQYNQPPYGQGQQAYGQPAYGQPQYGGPPVYTQPQKKSSLRWLWLTLGIVGGLLVLGCVICGIAGALGFNFLAQTVGPQIAVQQYYQAIEQQDYATAYSYLTHDATITVNGQGIPVRQETAFEAAAKAVDTGSGTVSKYNATPSGSDTSHVTVTVTRNSQSYDVHLVLAKVNNAWKIQSADGI